MNAAVLRHAFRHHRTRLLAICGALAVWGLLMPVIYATFGIELRALADRVPALGQLGTVGGGNLFSLAGWIGLGLAHPIAIALLSVFAIGYCVSAVAGERQRGTLEVVLGRPVSRRSLCLTVLGAATLFVAAAVAAALVGTAASAAMMNVLDELIVEHLPALWLNMLALYLAIAAISLAASVSHDRTAPAAALALAIVLTSYSLQFIGTIWPDADWLRSYSLFHYLRPDAVLESGLPIVDVVVLAAVALAATAYALVVFLRRDIAAPA